MHFAILFATIALLALSNCTFVPGSDTQTRFKGQPPCNNVPRATVDSVNATALAQIVEDYMPPVINGTSRVLGFMPENILYSPLPNVTVFKDKYYEELSRLSPNNTALFLRKVVLNLQTYPWCTIGKITTYDNAGTFLHSCSGTLVGVNLMLTASHCVPWEQPDGEWSMKFIPAYNGEDLSNPRPFGNAWATRCRGVRNTDDVTGLDYVICQLDTSIGNTVGYVGWRSSSGDDMYSNGRWTSVGYPDDFHEGQVAAVEDGIKLDDVDDEGSDGKELESYVYASFGWSGGPLFDIEPDWPRVVGVMSGTETEFSLWDFFTATHSVSAGGTYMGQLVTYGRTFWAP